MRTLLLFIIVTVSGCSIISDKKYGEELSKDWIGKNISEITKQQGRPPSRVVTLPDGAIFYVWSADTSFTTNINCQNNSQGNTACSGGDYFSGSCEVTAEADNSGIITKVFSSGCSHFKTGEYRYR